jgi:hypothetical protein
MRAKVNMKADPSKLFCLGRRLFIACILLRPANVYGYVGSSGTANYLSNLAGNNVGFIGLDSVVITAMEIRKNNAVMLAG